MMKPAANAPSTTSRPSEPAIATSPPSSSSASRSASCPLECIVASISRTTRAGRARVVSSPAATTMTAKTSSSTVRHSSPDATASTIERATIGQELARRADGEHHPADAVLAQVGVAQDRHQRAERGGGQREPDQHRRADHVARVERGGERHPQDQRQQPAGARELGRAPAHRLGLDLHPGHEEQEGQAEVREGVEHRVRMREVEHLRADDDPGEDLGHHDRDADLRREVGQQRGERRHREHHHHRLARDVHMRAEGLEPPSLAAPGPKPGVSASSTTPADAPVARAAPRL